MNENKITITREIQDYIQKNIQKSITLKDISNHVSYSLWHTARVFKDVMGYTIFEYIRKVRLTHAAIILRDTQHRVIDVALDFVFESQEGFTRAFSKEFNISPKAYQRLPIPLQYFIPFKMENTHKRKDTNKMKVKACFIQVVERPLRKAIIKRGIKATHYFEYCNEVDCDIWGLLSSVKEAISEPVGMWLSAKLQKHNTSMYVQGVEVPHDYKGIVPEGCELIELPETLMVIFQGEPYDDDNFEQEVSEVMEFASKYNPSVYGYEYDKDGYRFQYEPQGYRGYIEGRTVKKIS